MPYARLVTLGRRAALAGVASLGVGASMVFALPSARELTVVGWVSTAFIVAGAVLAVVGGGVAWLLTLAAFTRGLGGLVTRRRQ